MRRLVQMRDPLVRPVHGKGVLNQIVRPDAEEIDLAREPLRAHGRARDLDHRADFRFRVEAVALLVQLRFALMENREGAIQFLQA